MYTSIIGFIVAMFVFWTLVAINRYNKIKRRKELDNVIFQDKYNNEDGPLYIVYNKTINRAVATSPMTIENVIRYVINFENYNDYEWGVVPYYSSIDLQDIRNSISMEGL